MTSRSDTFRLHTLPGPHQFLLTSLGEIFNVIINCRQRFGPPRGAASILHSVSWRPVGVLSALNAEAPILPPTIVVSASGARVVTGEVDLQAVAMAAIKARFILVSCVKNERVIMNHFESDCL